MQNHQAIAHHFDTWAETYDDIIKKVDYQLLAHVKKLFNEYGINGGSILDIGCGNGALALNLVGTFDYTGVDVSPKMLEEAKKRGYKTIDGPIETVLPALPAKSFDYVVSLSNAYFIEDIEQTIRDIDRISRKGWVMSLDHITPALQQRYKDIMLYNHDVNVHDMTDDSTLPLWKSVGTDEMISGRVIFKLHAEKSVRTSSTTACHQNNKV